MELDQGVKIVVAEDGALIVDAQLSPGSGVDAVARIMQTQTIPRIPVSANFARLRELRPEVSVLEKSYTQASLALAMHRAGADRWSVAVGKSVTASSSPSAAVLDDA
jgi:hypothetical protein